MMPHDRQQARPVRPAGMPSRPPQKELRVRSFGMSDVGLVRVVNEDAFAADDARRLYIVADGMGGHNHGEVASRIAIDAIHTGAASATGATGVTTRTAGLHAHSVRLKRAVEGANTQVLAAIPEDASLLGMGMGTTVVGAMLRAQIMAIAHIGDSRVYRRRNGQLEQLTEDHTYVNDGVRSGQLTAAQARVHPLRNIVTRALGGDADSRVDVTEVEARPGDLFLLCSDGLTTMLTDRQINRWLATSGATGAAGAIGVVVSLEEICRGLIQAANARGGYDNVTAVLVQIAEGEAMR